MARDDSDALDTLVHLALAEDVGAGDWTTRWTVQAGQVGEARISAKQPLVVSGVEAVRRVFAAVDPEIRVQVRLGEGGRAEPGDLVVALQGPLTGILTAERTALNFLGRLSGIATLTARFVDAVAGTQARVIDTRKTTPGFRMLEKAAVRAGGGENHRMGLHDMVLIKENHIAAAGGVAEALARVAEANTPGRSVGAPRRADETSGRADETPERVDETSGRADETGQADEASGWVARAPALTGASPGLPGLEVEIEVRTLDELEVALAGAPDRILLDNMSLAELRTAVERVGRGASRPFLEASGNVRLDTVRAIAETGVDLISVGALTHSAPVADLSLRVPSLERR